MGFRGRLIVDNEWSSDSEKMRAAKSRPARRRGQPPARSDPPEIDWSKIAPPETLKGIPLADQTTPPVRNGPALSGSGFLQQSSGFPAAETSPPVRQISLARCHVTAVKEQRILKLFSRKRGRRTPNNSKVATLTKEISVSNSVTRTVTIESSKLKGHNAQVGVTLIGFGGGQGQIQQQLNQRYSVATQNSITISEKNVIQVRPASTVEHVIQWKLVSLMGIAILGESPRFSPSFDLAEVSYQVPLRLTLYRDY
jgi:hypothetical protein